MLLTVLMFVILIVCFALMFGLVSFSERVIARTKIASQAESHSVAATKTRPS